MRPNDMRIAYVINSVEGGGAASPVPDIADVIHGTGAKIRIFALTRRDGRALDAIAKAGIDVVVRNGGLKDHVAAFRWLDREIRAWRATHLWTSLTRATLLGQIVGAVRRLPVVSWQHAAFLKPANEKLLRLMARRSVLWVADSQQVAELTERRLRVPSEKLVTWSIFAADPVAPQAQAWREGAPFIIGSLGRLHRVKGYDVLITALARLQAQGFAAPVPFRLQIAGDGAEGEALATQIREAGLTNVELVGFTANPLDFLAMLNGYVQPSRSEGFCIAAHQAMQAGLPVIASAVGELAYTIEPGVNGLLVPSNDPEALAGALQSMLSDPLRARRWGNAGREKILGTYSRERFETIGRQIISRLAALQ